MAKGKSRHCKFYKLMLHNYRKMLILILPVVLVLVILIALVMRGQYKNAIQQSELICNKISTAMTDELMDLQRFVNTLAGNSDIRSMARQKNTALTRLHMRRVSNIMKLLKDESEHNALCSDGIIYFDVPRYFIGKTAAWKYETEAEAYYSIVPQMMVSLYGTDEKWQVDQGNVFYIKTLFGENVGRSALLLLLDASSVTNALSASLLQGNMHAYWVEDDRILGASDLYSTGKRIRELYPQIPMKTGAFYQSGCQYYVTWSEETIDGWRYTLVSDWNQLFLGLKTYLAIAISFFCMFVVFCLIVAYWIANGSCKPFEIIVELLKNPAEISETDYISHYKAYDELGMIAALIHETKYQYVAMQNVLTAKEALLAEAQNAALQSQMNPHFLFNTLETINWMAIEQLSQENQISYIIMRLSTLLRTSMQVDQPLIQIKMELSNAKTYLDIQHMRYPGQFTVVWDIDDRLLHYSTICLSIQPLLENAIKHGLVSEKQAQICIRCARQDNMICFEVTDNGAGIEAERLKQLQCSLREKCFARGHKIGLYNLNMRMQLLFGEEYHLEIERIPFVRTCIRMRIPQITA